MVAAVLAVDKISLNLTSVPARSLAQIYFWSQPRRSITLLCHGAGSVSTGAGIAIGHLMYEEINFVEKTVDAR